VLCLLFRFVHAFARRLACAVYDLQTVADDPCYLCNVWNFTLTVRYVKLDLQSLQIKSSGKKCDC